MMKEESKADIKTVQSAIVAEKDSFRLPRALKSYSWEIHNEICAVKTVDKTLRDDGITGIPMKVVSFFTGRLLDEGEEQLFDFFIQSEIVRCVITKKQGRHRLLLAGAKQRLLSLGIQVGDLLIFERDIFSAGRFCISALNGRNEVVVSPSKSIPPGQDRLAYSKTRVGQGIFREQVRVLYNYRCCLSGVEDIVPSILIASHIKPWEDSAGEEKTDKFNGLLLAPHFDKLFDKGFISFSDKGELLLSKNVPEFVVKDWRLGGKRLSVVHPLTKPYLASHRKHFGFETA